MTVTWLSAYIVLALSIYLFRGDIAEIPLKRRKSSIQPTNQPFIVSNWTQRRNGCVVQLVDYDCAFEQVCIYIFRKFHLCAENSPIFTNTNKVAVTILRRMAKVEIHVTGFYMTLRQWSLHHSCKIWKIWHIHRGIALAVMCIHFCAKCWSCFN